MSEYRFASTQEIIYQRRPKVIYDVEHSNGYFYVRSNDGNAWNFELFSVPIRNLTDKNILIYSSPLQFIEFIEIAHQHVIAWIRQDGLRKWILINLITGISKRVDFNSSSYALFPSTIDDLESRLYRNDNSPCFLFTNSSFLNPPKSFYFDLLHGNIYSFDPFSTISSDSSDSFNIKLDNDGTEKYIQVQSTHSQNIQIPLSIIFQSKLPGPFILISYGAYGTFMDPSFSADRIPLFQRGVSFGICHPRFY